MSAPLGNAASSWHTPCDRLQLSLPLAIMASQNTPTVDEKQLDDGGFDFLGKELDNNARIWNVYRDEITADDKAHGFELWLQTLDILLIFAGLFSAVVTTFLIDSYKLLQKPDQNDFIAAALYALVVATNNSALLVDLPKPRPLSLVPSHTERWVNALWFTSLIIALAVALLAILAKQWLQEFHRRLADSNTAGSTPTPSNEWTRKRWFYLRGMTQTWPMDGFITYLLPVMLHIALFLFLAGLTLFLWSVDDIVSRIVLALSAFIIAFYVTCTLLPLWCPDAPTSTPLLKQLLVVVHAVPTSLLHISIAFCQFLEKFETRNASSTQSLPSLAQTPAPATYSLVQGQRKRLEGTLVRLQNTTDPSIVRSESSDEREKRLGEILTWLIVTCTSENAVMIGFQGVGALDPDSEVDSKVIPRLREATVGMSALAHYGSNKTPSALDAIRAIRSELVLGRGTWRSTELVLNVPSPMLAALKDVHVPEAMLLVRSLEGGLPGDDRDITRYLDWTSGHQVSSLASTAHLLLHCNGRMDFDVLTTLLLLLDYRTLPPQSYNRILSLCGDRADMTGPGDALDHCVATLLHRASQSQRAARIIWRLMSSFDHDKTARRLDRHLDTLGALLSQFPEALIFDIPRPDLCDYACRRTVTPVLALPAALALLQPHFPPLHGLADDEVHRQFVDNIPLALGRLLLADGAASCSGSHVCYVHVDVWAHLLDLAATYHHSHWIAAAICWLQRRKVPEAELHDLKDNFWFRFQFRNKRFEVDMDTLHLAQHFRELFPDWRQRLTELSGDDIALFAELVATAPVCIYATTCPGTPPAQWPDESEPASVTVPSPAAQQPASLSSPIVATTTTSSDPLAESPTAQPVPIASSSPPLSAAPAASNSVHSLILAVSSVSPQSSISSDDQCALHAVSILEPERVLAPSVAPHAGSVSGPDATTADAVPEPEARVQAPVADRTLISPPSGSSEALESDSDASSSPLPQVLAPGPAHLGTDKDASDSSSSTGGRDGDVGHPASDEHASADREPASEPQKTAHAASSEGAQGGTGGAGTALPPAVTPKADASAENLVLPIDEPGNDEAPTQPSRTMETDPKLPRSVISDNEDM